MTTCKDFEPLLSLRAAGALAPAEAAPLEAHLAGCAACRAEAAACAEVLSLAKLPPPTEDERRATAGLAAGALAVLHRREGRTTSWKRTAAAVLAAAALLVAVLAPALLGKKPAAPPYGLGGGPSATAAVWEEPDLDALWSDAEVLELDGATASGSDASDAAVASLDL